MHSAALTAFGPARHCLLPIPTLQVRLADTSYATDPFDLSFETVAFAGPVATFNVRAFDGEVPGPTLIMERGVTNKLDFVNAMPTAPADGAHVRAQALCNVSLHRGVSDRDCVWWWGCRRTTSTAARAARTCIPMDFTSRMRRTHIM